MSVQLQEPAAAWGSKSPFTLGLGDWETSADSVYCRDLDGQILAANRAFTRKFGRSPSVMLRPCVADFLHADDLPSVEASTAQLARPPHRARAEHRWLTPQGLRWMAWEETALRDATGAIVGIRAVGHDITRQRLTEEQCYRFSHAAQQSPVSIAITDLDGRAEYVNPRYTAVTGYTLEEVVKRNIQVLRDGHLDDASYEKFLTTIRAGGKWRGELATRSANAATVWESIKVSCLHAPSGEITHFLSLREDVTETKRLEHELRQAQKMESLGTLAGGIAHDFNNLLAIINGYAELCQQEPQPPVRLQKSVREIHRAAQRAIGLVKQILTFSRKSEVRFSAVDLNQLSQDLVSLMSETFPRTVAIRLDLQEGLPPLHADQNQLRQIVLNLCVNARDAMLSGGAMTLTTSNQPGDSLRHLGGDPARNYACLSVADTGVGISPEVRPHIFQPFFTTKQGNEGTGLGLAVVYGIVVAHQGFIDVESKPGAGSTFRVYLPLAVTATEAPAQTGAADFPGGTESLLIVDDEAALRALLSLALAEKGYTTTAASSGLEAIELIRDPTREFAALLLDVNLPGASGVDVLKIVRVCRPTLPVLVLSGHLTPEARVEFERLGQRLFMQKPCSLHDLGTTLRALLQPQSAETVQRASPESCEVPQILARQD